MLVVMADVDREDSFEVASVHDQDPVETLATDCADPPFDEGVRAGRAHRGADRPDAFGAEHLVGGRELAVAIVDQEPDRLRSFDEGLDHVPCLLGRPRVAILGPAASERASRISSPSARSAKEGLDTLATRAHVRSQSRQRRMEPLWSPAVATGSN